ncbi:hypothetical protein [Silvibacterium dinghuense]|uniref:Uncharacterized protein n=1 Tax=Silvibacterium dinghuense TaxID=1560006 RepID=A0A4Q1SH58_9BACT|nr:hypothetical protein [Silvibacterium dinghuense]RXS96874.1 hypothetical protein ESZ00_02740 [Silvibacterium dinghuense]GGG94346.1 hypothetical protein GCM10011586_06540 [Silvibacterium dinghuense]
MSVGRLRIFSLAGLLLASFAPGIASAQQQPVTVAQQKLLQVKAGDMDTSVSPALQSAISAFKTALAAQTDAVITQLPPQSTAEAAQQRLAAAMPSPAVGKPTDTDSKSADGNASSAPTAGQYGGELQLSVTQPEPSLFLVQESFDIACGDDTVLLAYRNESGHWQRILLWQSKPYNEISGAFGDTYAVQLLHPQRNGHPLLLVLHGTPWCTSTMSSFHMDVFELGASPANTPLWHGDHGYRRLDLDPPLTLKLTADGFEVRTSVSEAGDRIFRKGVMRYAFQNDAIHRIEPIAMNAHDSVEEWLEMPRSEAAGFADDVPGSLTWKMFQDFTWEGRPEGAHIPLAEVGAVRACTDSTTHFQAEVTSTIYDPSGKQKDHPGPTYFVQLQQVSNGYRIHSAAQSPDPACKGPDLMSGSHM